MQFGLLTSTLLCVFAWMNSIQTVHGLNGLHDCKCVRPTKTQIPKKKLVSYTIQDERFCNVRVIVFTTVENKTICSDPNSSWTKEGMKTLDKKKAMIEAQRKREEYDKTPTASLTNPTLTPQTESTSTLSVSTSIPSVSTSTLSVSTSTPSVSTSTPSVSTVAPTETTTAAASTLKSTAAPSSDQTLSPCQKKQRAQNTRSRKHRMKGGRGIYRRKNKGRMKKWQKKNKAQKQLQIVFRCKEMLPN